MGQAYPIRLYYETGFDKFNRPDSVAVLRNATTKTFAANYLREDKYRQQVKISATFSEVEGADYCTIGDTCYFVVGISMPADHLALLTLERDSVATIGVSNIQVIGGWCKRRHVKDDTLFRNDINEPFQPREHLQIDEGCEIGFTSNPETLLASTISLRASDLQEAKTYISESTTNEVTVPDVKPVPYQTICTIPALEDDVTRQYQIPMTLIYANLFGIQNVDIETALGNLRALGLENAITACYQVPIDAFQGVPGELPYVNECASLIGKSKEVTTGLNFVFGTFKNNKVYSGQYSDYVFACLATGSQSEFKPEDIYSSSNPVKAVLYADPSPTGRPYCRPQTFRQNTDSLWMAVVPGAQWLNAPIRYDESMPSGYAKQVKQMTYANTQIQANLEIAELNAGLGILSGGVSSAASVMENGMITNPGFSAAAGALDIVGKFANRDLNREAADRAIQHNKQMTLDIAKPEVVFPQTDNMAAYYGHKFIVFRRRMTTRDMQRFDKFLTMYGYAVDEPFTADALNCRQYFNYITLADAQIKTPGYGYSMKMEVMDAFSGGVRLWHTLPTPEAYDNNPIVTED